MRGKDFFPRPIIRNRADIGGSNQLSGLFRNLDPISAVPKQVSDRLHQLLSWPTKHDDRGIQDKPCDPISFPKREVAVFSLRGGEAIRIEELEGVVLVSRYAHAVNARRCQRGTELEQLSFSGAGDFLGRSVRRENVTPRSIDDILNNVARVLW